MKCVSGSNGKVYIESFVHIQSRKKVFGITEKITQKGLGERLIMFEPIILWREKQKVSLSKFSSL